MTTIVEGAYLVNFVLDGNVFAKFWTDNSVLPYKEGDIITLVFTADEETESTFLIKNVLFLLQFNEKDAKQVLLYTEINIFVELQL